MPFIWLAFNANIMKKIVSTSILFFGLFLTLQVLSSQDIILKPETSDNILSMLKDSKVENIRIMSSDEEVMNIEVRYKASGDDESQIIVSGIVMDERKQEIKAIVCDPETMSRGANSVDLSFRATNLGDNSSPFLNSKYIKVFVAKKEKDTDDAGSLLDDLSSLFGDGSDSGLEGLTSESYLFKYDKEWRIPGNKDMIITVSFTPIGKAINAKM